MCLLRIPRRQDAKVYVQSRTHPPPKPHHRRRTSSFLCPATLPKLRKPASNKISLTDNWSEKAKRRRTVGTGRCRYLKEVSRRFKNGFQTGTPKAPKFGKKATEAAT